MELKQGYKQTEVGVIPEDWDLCSLTDLSSKITDGDHLTPKRERSGYYLLSARNVLNGRIDVRDVDYVGHAEYQRMKQRCGPEAGDILISCSGTIGRVAVVPKGLECVLVRSAALAKIDKSLANGTFLQFWLQGRNAQSQISGSVNQGAQSNLFLNQIERLKCPKPPLAEQLSIAEVLNSVDELVSDLDQLIIKKRSIKQAAMQELLTGKRRLPGFEGEWEVKRLGELGDFLKGSGVKKDEAASGDLPCVRYGEIYTHHENYVSEFRSYISEAVSSGATPIREGDILFAGSGETKEEIGKAVALHHPVKAFAGGDIVILRQSSNYALFLGYRLNANDVSRQKAGLGQGDAVVHISAHALSKIAVSLPEKAEQEAIAGILYVMDTELSQLQLRLAKTQELKQGMMQQLLTGKIRLT